MTLAHSETGLMGALADLLVELEAEHHRSGWDERPATLYIVCRSHDTTLRIAPCELILAGAHPRDQLRAIAQVTTEHASEVRDTLPPGVPVAAALVTEAWGSDDPEAHVAVEERGARLADIVGSRECRWALAVCGKHRLSVNRLRGESPRYHRSSPEDLRGTIPEALAAVYRATRRVYANAPGGYS
jgi:hypothetical protein